jgi:UDP-N-acetyl-D-galactosamine dehydrogenase
VILAGRRINDEMGHYVAEKTVKLLRHRDRPIKDARIGVLGVTFKEDVPDLRNSRVPDIVAELREYGIEPLVHDPLASPEEALAEHGIRLQALDALSELDGLVLAVPHRPYLEDVQRILQGVGERGVVVDVKSASDPGSLRADLLYWSL